MTVAKINSTRGPDLIEYLVSDLRRKATTSKNPTITSEALLLNMRSAIAVGRSMTIQSGAVLTAGKSELIESLVRMVNGTNRRWLLPTNSLQLESDQVLGKHGSARYGRKPDSMPSNPPPMRHRVCHVIRHLYAAIAVYLN
jgi:hypothetical protein